MLHILICTSWYKTKEKPTLGSFVEEQAKMLMNFGFKVTVLHCYLKGTFFKSFLNRKTELSVYDDDGLQTIQIGVSPVFPKARNLSYSKLKQKTYKEVSKLNIKPDIIHSHSCFMGGVVGSYLSYKFGVRQFHTEHTSGLISRPNQYTLDDVKHLKKVYSNSKKVFFVSEFAKNKIINIYEIKTDNCEVLHNVVSPLFFTNNYTNINDRFSYLAIGHVVESKGIKNMIDSWKLVIQMFPKSILTIAGDGLLKDDMMEYAKVLGLNKSLRWLPNLDRIEVKEQIEKHHVVISASQLETFGLTIAEAVACGKPVVVMDSGGVRDIVDINNGLICNQDVLKFYEALCEIQKNYTKYDAKLIREKAKSKFSENTIASKLIDFYKTN